MRTVGIKLADGTFYPVMEEGTAQEKTLELTTAHNNQTCVMVDMYRSKSCTMEDAEYIDTLKIDNLVAHSHGEPDIIFSIGLDENNQLSARIVDTETGAQSKSTITLISRTIEERLVADDYTIVHTGNTIEGSLSDSDSFVISEEPSETEIKSEEENNIKDELKDVEITEEPSEAESRRTGNTVAGVIAGGGLLAAASAIRKQEEEKKAAQAEQVPSITIEDEPIIEETAIDDLNDLTIEETATDDLSDLTIEKTATDNLSDLTIEETSSEDLSSLQIEDPVADDAFTLNEPDEEFNAAALDLPDFGNINSPEDEPEETNFADFDIPNFEEEKLSDSDDNSLSFDDDIAPAAAAGGLSFTGLYDKETEMGESGFYEEENKKHTKVPVIICIICAIICLLATLLILFIIPSKYNLLKKTEKTTTAVEKTVEAEEKQEPEIKAEEPAPVVEEKIVEPEPEPVVEEEKAPEAKEDEVIVIVEAENVVPLPPPVEKVEPIVVTYKIKWGDTLWDIAETYYKNPWRYKFIAKYNHIRNPDYIISGTTIQIPED